VLVGQEGGEGVTEGGVAGLGLGLPSKLLSSSFFLGYYILPTLKRIRPRIRPLKNMNMERCYQSIQGTPRGTTTQEHGSKLGLNWLMKL
jgi:hypothetical protein